MATLLPAGADEVLDLATYLARLLVGWSYEGTRDVERHVRRVAHAYGHPVEVSVLPESAVVEIAGQSRIVTSSPRIPPLHKVSELEDLLAAIERGEMYPGEASVELHRIAERPPPFGSAWKVLGVALFSVGFGVSVQATWQEALATGGLGLVVGLLIVAADRWPQLDKVVPLVASIIVGLVVLGAYREGWIDGGPIPLMIPALFMFIPGDALSVAMLELTDGRITAGAARLIQSLAVLGVLAFGAVLAVEVLGLPHTAVFDTPIDPSWGPVAPWIGWAIYSVGILLAFEMRPRDLPWAAAMVFGTYAVLLAATWGFGEVAGTFLAAVAMTVATEVLGRSDRRPPAFVMFLGAFFVLTSGGVGLRGLETWIGGDTTDGFADIGAMFALLTALGLGILVGSLAQPAAPPPGPTAAAREQGPA